jgi:glyoxylase-like metal-dependent hydrolase (beta-lactamase superfamily II)
MVDVREVADRIYRFETPIPPVGGVFAVYLINEPQGVLIEPGPAAAVPIIREAMQRVGMKGLAYIIPTHIHMDHAGGMGTLAQLFPQARVLVHPTGAKHAIDPSRLIEGTRMVFGADFEALYGPILPVPESQVYVPEDGEVVSVDGRELQVIYAPGHAQHHMAILDRSVQGLFCGEALGIPVHRTRPLAFPSVAPPNFDPELYLSTIERLRQLQPRIVFYSHGPVVTREPELLMESVAENTRGFGDLILNALKQGQPQEEVKRRLDDFMAGRLGIRLDEGGLAMTVGGYTMYYQSKGLV